MTDRRLVALGLHLLLHFFLSLKLGQLHFDLFCQMTHIHCNGRLAQVNLLLYLERKELVFDIDNASIFLFFLLLYQLTVIYQPSVALLDLDDPILL